MMRLSIRMPFPHRVGMGAAPQIMNPGQRGRSNYWGGQPATVNLATATSATPASSVSATIPTRRGGRPMQQQNWKNGNSQSFSYAQGGGQYGGSGSQNQNNTPTQADLAAFDQALSNASALGVITTTEAAQYQSVASTATDAQLQALTTQINALVASTPSASASAAVSAADATAATATTGTSWWDGTTVLFGSTISNSTLAIGAGLVAILGYAFLKKK